MLKEVSIEPLIKECVRSIRMQIINRSYRVSNEMANVSQPRQRSQSSSRTYYIPGTKRKYSVSVPDALLAMKTGVSRSSWTSNTYISGFEGNALTAVCRIESDLKPKSKSVDGYGSATSIQDGMGKETLQPQSKGILQEAQSRALRIYSEPYF